MTVHLRAPGGDAALCGVAADECPLLVERVEEAGANGAEACRACCDVADRRRLAEALARTEDRLRLALEAGHLGDWAWAASTDEVELSPRACRIFRVAEGTVTTWTEMQSWLDPDDAARAAAAVTRALESRTDYAIDYRLRRRDDPVWIASRGRGIYDASGRAVGMIGVVPDVTARKRIEEQHRFLAELAAITTPLVDPDRTAVAVARKLAEHLGADRCAYAESDGLDDFEVVGDHGASLPSIVGRYRLEDFGAEFARCMRGDEPYAVTDIETDPQIAPALRESYRAIGARSVFVVPFVKDGRFAGGFAVHQARPRAWRSDEVELLRLAADRCWEAIERARVLRRLREQDQRKDEFLATLAHELRNPLAPLRNGLELLKLAPDEATATKLRDVMERQLRHMVRLVDDLLDVSRINRGRLELVREPVRVAALIQDAVDATRPLAHAADHELRVEIDEQPLWVLGDLTRLAQIVSNLLHNAIKYTPNGGHILLTAVREAHELVVRVRDDGIGLPADMLPRIFDRFVQVGGALERSQGGLGIGLSIVRSLVELHGGTIAASSDGIGHGSTFTVRLPLIEPPATAHESSRAQANAPRPEPSRRVLVVDDNVDSTQSLAALLSHAGHVDRVAHDGISALAIARELEAELVFLDIGLPELNGYEVARRIRAEPALADAVLIAVTGWGSAADRRRAADAGFDRHLTKPVEPTAVRDALRLVRERGSTS